MKHCNNCKYAIKEDNGYSNWTVEGTDIDCLKGLNPNFPVDAWYGDCKEGLFAEQCSSFSNGDPTHIDVDQESGALEDYTNDEELKDLLRKRQFGE